MAYSEDDKRIFSVKHVFFKAQIYIGLLIVNSTSLILTSEFTSSAILAVNGRGILAAAWLSNEAKGTIHTLFDQGLFGVFHGISCWRILLNNHVIEIGFKSLDFDIQIRFVAFRATSTLPLSLSKLSYIL